MRHASQFQQLPVQRLMHWYLPLYIPLYQSANFDLLALLRLLEQS